MHGVDGGLELIRTWLVATNAAADDRLALLDQGPIPRRAILFAEQYERSIGSGSRRATRFGEQQQRQQAGHLRLVGHERHQEPCKPDRLRTQMGSRVDWSARRCRRGRRRQAPDGDALAARDPPARGTGSAPP